MPLSERKLIERIAQASRARDGSKLIATGIGDDCAVLRVPEGHEMLVTTDFSLEGVHFRREWHPADAVGHRCLTRGLSDIASMGGEPLAAFLSLALPEELPQRWADQFVKGMLALARRFGVTLAGGDIAQSPAGVLADITVVGSVPAGQAILRSGARPGDSIYVTGELGAPVALLEQMIANPERKFRAAAFPAHFYPEPRIAVARQLRTKKVATAMIDISDGLSTDLSHICESSGVGATIIERALPIASLGRHEVERRHALHGGDEYQLLFTAAPARRLAKEIAGVPITRIGYINEGSEILIEHENGYTTELNPGGWEHFSTARRRKH
ncbi:MAG: thiamine-phosphate kinase [Candidatus Korobacteraceae bacterium]|jgi:thiamine-monophosphate kinase